MARRLARSLRRRPTPSCASSKSAGWRPNPPSLNIFGPGPLLNLVDEQSRTNALAHLWFGFMVPLFGFYLGGHLGLRIAGVIAAAFVLVRQTFFHGDTPAPETRTDLLSGLLPMTLVVFLDAL